MYISKIYVILICFTVLYSYQKEESIKNSFSYYMNNSNENLGIIEQSDNNIFLAPLLSAVLPGAGQIYNKDYKRGYFYLSLEILSWLYRKNYLSKNENYERQYKNFANQHWSFEKWIKDYCLFANSSHPIHSTMINNETGFFYPWDDSHHISFYLNNELYQTNSSSGNDWFRNTYLDECNDAYNNNIQCDTEYFSDAEVLKDHHFYEGLGKYELFFAGWDDTHECEELGNSDDCSFIVTNGSKNNAFTANKLYYQYELRSKANDKSDIAENALTLIFVNHAVSMFDAFISNVIKNNNQNFNYYSSPLYDSSIKLRGINFSILW